MASVDRRRFLGGLGAAAVGAGAAGLAGCTSDGSSGAGATPAPGGAPAPGQPGGLSQPGNGSLVSVNRLVVRETPPFRGKHQAGISQAAPVHASFLAFDVAKGGDRASMRRLMRLWTDDIERMTQGHGDLSDLSPELYTDTAGLTVTVGVGPRFLDVIGRADQRPAWLAQLPAFPQIDKLQEQWNGGDLIVQVCSDDPVVVAHVGQRLTDNSVGLLVPRWVQTGFRGGTVPKGTGDSMRNLFGQVDGTVNPNPDPAGTSAGLVWQGDSAPAWLRGGSSMVVRRISMDLKVWDGVDVSARDSALGRRQSDGAPLSGKDATDPPDFKAIDDYGFTRIPKDAHIRRAHATDGTKESFLRRPYNYSDRVSPTATDHGLIFVAFQADPVEQFLPVQKRLAQADVLNTWTTPIGSAVFAIPRGAQPGEYLMQDLLEG